MKKHPREALLSAAELKDRWWTPAMIKARLGEPDDHRPNPRSSRAAPMRFWLKSRVEESEREASFRGARLAALDRSESAKAGVTTRIVNMTERMRAVEITIEAGWPESKLRKLAERTHGGNYAGSMMDRPFRWSKQTARNCIRHRLTNYEQLWELCNRGDTGADAYGVLRDRVDCLIDRTYPAYADEACPEPENEPLVGLKEATKEVL